MAKQARSKQRLQRMIACGLLCILNISLVWVISRPEFHISYRELAAERINRSIRSTTLVGSTHLCNARLGDSRRLACMEPLSRQSATRPHPNVLRSNGGSVPIKRTRRCHMLFRTVFSRGNPLYTAPEGGHLAIPPGPHWLAD